VTLDALLVSLEWTSFLRPKDTLKGKRLYFDGTLFDHQLRVGPFSMRALGKTQDDEPLQHFDDFSTH